MKPQQLIAVGYTPHVLPPHVAVSSCFRFHALPVFFEPGQYLWAVMDLQYPMDVRSLCGISPARIEYDGYYILTRIAIDGLRYGVFDGLVLF